MAIYFGGKRNWTMREQYTVCLYGHFHVVCWYSVRGLYIRTPSDIDVNTLELKLAGSTLE